MLISGLQSTTIVYTQLSVTSAYVTSRSANNILEGELSGLISAIKSGNTAEARSSLSEIKMLGAGNSDPASPLGVFLATVSNSLSNFNIAGAQVAVADLEATVAPRVEAVQPAAQLSLTAGERSGPAVNPLGEDLLNLFSAITAGDTDSAQSAYGSLNIQMKSSVNNKSSFGYAFENSTESGTLYSLLAQVGAALSTGNITRVQGVVDKFMFNLSSGSLVSATA
jgi:hypothetical protein